MDVIAARWPKTRPLVLGEPDGRLLRGVAVAHLSGVPIGGEVWLSGTLAETLDPHTVKLDQGEDVAPVGVVPEPSAAPTGAPLDVDTESLSREELLELARIRGIEIPKTAKPQLIRQRLRTNGR